MLIICKSVLATCFDEPVKIKCVLCHMKCDEFQKVTHYQKQVGASGGVMVNKQD